jgi:hypothetical protein
MWSPYGVWLGEFIFPCIPRWTPAGVQLDSRWILDKELAGLTPIKKRSKVHLDSRNPPGVHLESTWNLWLKVKSSAIPSGIHGIHPFHMESIWNTLGSVKYCQDWLPISRLWLAILQDS